MTETAEMIDQKKFAEALLEQAREQGVTLLGPGGLLAGLTKNVLETALGAEITEHLGHERHGPAGGGNVRNGTRSKTVFTEVGPVEIAAHFEDVYGATVSKDTISRITEKVSEEMAEWANRPMDRVYPVVFIDAIHVKVRDGQVRNKPFYVVLGVTVNGERDILGIWAGDGGEDAKYWLRVLTEVKNRGVEDVCISVCDGLKGLPEAITTVWEQSTVQTSVIPLIRNTFRYAPRQHWDELSRDLRPVYIAPTEAAARERFGEFEAKWATKYPAIGRLWRNAWTEFVPFLD
jgi:transposase-like protein